MIVTVFIEGIISCCCSILSNLMQNKLNEKLDKKTIENLNRRLRIFSEDYNDTEIDCKTFNELLNSDKLFERIYIAIFENYLIDNSIEIEKKQIVDSLTLEFNDKRKEIGHSSIKDKSLIIKYFNEIFNLFIEVRDEIQSLSEKTQVSILSEDLKTQLINNNKALVDDINNLLDKRELDTLKSINSFEQWLRGITNPSIDLNFFDYNNSNFAKEFVSKINNNEKAIYIKAKNKFEGLGYATYLLKHLYKNNVLIVDNEDKWNNLNNKIENKILIANFNYKNEVRPIINNISIFPLNIDDGGNYKETLVLKERVFDETVNAFVKAGLSSTESHNLVKKCDNLFGKLKCEIFLGVNTKPKWLEKTDELMKKILLIKSFTNKEIDKALITEFTECDFQNIIDKTKYLNGLDAENIFVVISSTFSGDLSYNISNFEEVWEFLINDYNDEPKLFDNYLEYCSKALNTKISYLRTTDYKMFENKDEISLTLFNGITDTLKKLSVLCEKGSIDKKVQYSLDEFVNKTINEYIKAETENYNNLYEILNYLVEVSPNKVLKFIESDIKNDYSKIINSFNEEKTSQMFLPNRNVNKVQNIVYILKKLMNDIKYAKKSFELLTYIYNEVNKNYIDTVHDTIMNAVSPCRFETIFNLEQKYELFKISLDESKDLEKQKKLIKFVENGFSESYVVYDDYNSRFYLNNNRSMTNKEYIETFFKYFYLVIENCNSFYMIKEFYNSKFLLNEKTKNWLFDKTKILLKNETEKEKLALYNFISEKIYSNRFFTDSDNWLDKEQIDELENEILNKIGFENELYYNVYLFTGYECQLRNPIKYSDENHYELNKKEGEKQRTEVLKYVIDSNFDLFDFIMLCDKSVYREIGSILGKNNLIDLFEENYISKIEQFEEVFLTYFSVCSDKLNFDETKNKVEFLKEIIKDGNTLGKILSKFKIKFLMQLNISEELMEMIWTAYDSIDLVHIIERDTDVKDEIFTNLFKYKMYEKLIIIFSHYKEADPKLIVDTLNLYVEAKAYENSVIKIEYSIKLCFKALYNSHTSFIEDTEIACLEYKYWSILNELDFFAKYIIDNPISILHLINSKIELYNFLNYNEKLYISLQKVFNNDVEKISIWIELLYKNSSEENYVYWVETILANLLANIIKTFEKNTTNTSFIVANIKLFELFEKYLVNSDQLKRRLNTSVFNSISSYTPAYGKTMKIVSDRYKKYADDLSFSCPLTASVFFDLSKGYKNKSDREYNESVRGRF